MRDLLEEEASIREQVRENRVSDKTKASGLRRETQQTFDSQEAQDIISKIHGKEATKL